MLFKTAFLLAAVGLVACGGHGGGGVYPGGAGGAYPGGGIVGGAPVGGPIVGGGPVIGSGAIAQGAAGQGFSPCSGPMCGPDFNPLLAGGNKGYPGLRARINQRSFQYASGIVGDLLNSEIKKARIPPISQCIPQVQGCIQIYNLYVSRYRCPQRVVLYPAPPNRLVLQVQNVDIGVTGNLGGQIVVLLPIALTGIIQLNLHQVTITVSLAVERTATGAPWVRMDSCQVNIGYADAYIENGGLIGDIVNSQFRSRISNQVKGMIPGQICGQLPSIINQKLNGKLAGLPQTISLTQMASMFGGALGLDGQRPSNEYCSRSCGAKTVAAAPATASASSSPVVSSPDTSPVAQIPQGAYEGHKHKLAVRASAAAAPNKVYQTSAQRISTSPVARGLRSPEFAQHQPHSLVPQARNLRNSHFISDTAFYDFPRGPARTSDAPFVAVQRAALIKQLSSALDEFAPESRSRSKRQSPIRQAPPAVYHAAVAQQQRFAQPQTRVARGGAGGYTGLAPRSGPIIAPPPAVAGAPVPQIVPPSVDLCAQCPSGGGDDPAGFIKQLAAHLDMSKLNDMYLSVQLLNTYATSNDFTVDLTGEFSPYGQGGTPFGAFPTQFPSAYDNHMIEFIVSDYTLNSLFYHMHRKGFISFRIGPDTPKIGELLKTTCSDDEDEDLEDHPVELDEEENEDEQLDDEENRRKRRRHILHNATHKLAKRAHHKGNSTAKRNRRQEGDEGGGLADLGICFGDILPAIREKYPNKKINIHIHTVRAPSVILSQNRGGMATIDLIADADIYIDGTNTKVGTITIASVVELVAQIQGNRISGQATITQLKLSDNAGTLGLPQDALDNLGNLGKELLQKLANDALGKGIALNIPQVSALPIQIINPEFHIIEHGLYIATDMTVNPSALGLIGGC